MRRNPGAGAGDAGGPDGHTPAIDGFAEKVRPLSAGDKALIREAAKRQSEEVAKKQMGVEHWVHDVVCRRNGIDPILWPRLAGSWPEFVFTGDPLRLPARPLRPGPWERSARA